jgi:aminoglycoside 3-N-acetyltransferase
MFPQLRNVPLYVYDNGKEIFFKDIVQAILNAGVTAGDTAIVHVDLGAFGKLGKIFDRTIFANIFTEAFLEVLGSEGTLLTPTFTYSFCKGEVYNPTSTPSTIGLYSEEFRKRPDALRSPHPIFSVAAIGKRAEEVTQNIGKNSFGVGSVYDKLHHIENSKYIVVGVPYWVCTQVHYVERLLEVPYRYVKNFSGVINIGGNEFEESYEYYVRYLDRDVNTTFDKIEKHLIDNGFLRKVSLGLSHISTVKNIDIWNESTQLLKDNPLLFLKNKPDM